MNRPHHDDTPPHLDADLRARILARCRRDPETGCLLWTGGRSGNGYGHLWYRGAAVAVHRLMLQLYLGREFETHEHALHRCDVPTCVDRRHLFVGTDADNIRDAAAKGRTRHRAVLTPVQVIEIRARHAAGESTPTLGRAYGVSATAIGYIVRRQRWAHVEAA